MGTRAFEMSATILAFAPVDLGVESLQRQLFRYAQDLQELMEQQRQLQQNYQMVLKSMGREVPDNDLLASTLIAANQLNVITDTLGNVLRHSPDVVGALGLSGRTFIGEPIDALLGPASFRELGNVLAKFAKSQGLGGIEQRRLELGQPGQGSGLGPFDLLVMQVAKENGRREIAWLFQPAIQSSAIAIQSAFINASTADVAVFVTDPTGTICSINEVLTKMTGFYSADVLGQNPRLLGSGRHENAFFQDFFLALLDAGCWNGQILNRKKTGQIFLTWQSVKMVEDGHGQVSSYIAAVADLSLTESNASLTSPASYHDPITGLSNRRTLENYFGQALEQARAKGSTLRALFLNIDGLGRIGEELGYAVFDQGRRELGLRLQSMEKPHLRIADVGGANFVMLLEGTTTDSEVADMAAAATQLLEAPLHIEQHRPRIKTYIGCASYPKDGVDVGTLLKHADAAMYGAKKFATPFCFYESAASPTTVAFN
jgi:diguanylate cyclase (GGDEF)-like protein/PAS domain S-box-containing protein